MMPDSPANLSHFKVAVLDDVASTLTMTKLVLESQLECDVDTYAAAEAILEIEPKDLPDLFLLDIVMEGMDGLELCRKLKARPETAHIPIIFLSAHGDCESRVTALQAGGVDYIDKPFYPEELVARVRTQILLHHSSKQLRQQAAEQQALLRILCHDLQNPVAAVDSILEMLTDAPGESEELLPLARTSISAALDLIEHVRGLRHLLGSGQAYAAEDVPVTEAFDEVGQINHPRAAKKNLTLDFEAKEQAILKINRVVLIHNILNNLLSNAIKFSQPGSTIHLRCHGQENGFIHLEVEDHGIGMDEKKVRTLFDQEKNTSSTGTGQETGLGFGMPLVKRYIDLFRGRVVVDSQPLRDEEPLASHGTRIHLYLPGKAT